MPSVSHHGRSCAFVDPPVTRAILGLSRLLSDQNGGRPDGIWRGAGGPMARVLRLIYLCFEELCSGTSSRGNYLITPTGNSKSARSSARLSASASHLRSSFSSMTFCSTLARMTAPIKILRRVSDLRSRFPSMAFSRFSIASCRVFSCLSFSCRVSICWSSLGRVVPGC